MISLLTFDGGSLVCTAVHNYMHGSNYPLSIVVVFINLRPSLPLSSIGSQFFFLLKIINHVVVIVTSAGVFWIALHPSSERRLRIPNEEDDEDDNSSQQQ